MKPWWNWTNRLILGLSLLSVMSCAPTADLSTTRGTEKDLGKSSVSRTEPSADGEVEEVAGAAPDDDPIVCEWYAETGRRIQKKVCMKKSQWDRYNASGTEATSEIQRRGGLGGPRVSD